MTTAPPTIDRIGAEAARSCEVHHEPLAELVAALASIGDAGVFGARYPSALRAEGRDLAAAAFDAATAEALAPEVERLGVNQVVSAAITRDLPSAPGDEASALVERIAQAAELSAVPAPAEDAQTRLPAMHRASGYEQASVAADARIALYPVRLLPPAPAGKLFARDTPPGRPLRMAFGDTGHVGADDKLDWLQWYRLGVWHATLNKQWGPQVAAAATARLREAFASLPPEQRRKAGVHEAMVLPFKDWSAYFLDGLVSAGKIVLESDVVASERGHEQQRWLRALGRVHIDWFVEQIERDGVAHADVAALADDWLSVRDRLAEARVRFAGPLAACESPMWNEAAEVCYSPSVPRASRRGLNMWLRGQWPGEVTAVDGGDRPAAPSGARLVFALAEDAGWLDELAGDVAPDDREAWRRLAGEGGLLYAYRHAGTETAWSRVSIAPDADALARLQQARRPFADWTALAPGGDVRSGELGYDDRGRLRLLGAPTDDELRGKVR